MELLNSEIVRLQQIITVYFDAKTRGEAAIANAMAARAVACVTRILTIANTL